MWRAAYEPQQCARVGRFAAMRLAPHSLVVVMTRILALLLAIVSGIAHSDNYKRLDLVSEDALEYYPSLVFMTMGPAEDVVGSIDPNRLERLFRISNIQSEKYVLIYIEEISVGEEQSYSLHSTRRIEQVFLGLMANPRWVSVTELEFDMDGERYSLSGLDSQSVTLRKIMATNQSLNSQASPAGTLQSGAH